MPEPDVEFLKNSLLDVLVPQASDLNVADALASTRDEGRLEDTILISSIAQRSVLFFGQLISYSTYKSASYLFVGISR